MDIELFKFAYFPKFEDSIKDLAENLADKENWDFSTGSGKNSILKNYIFHTFSKINDEKKIVFSAGNVHACFNTGLVTSNWEEIVAFFEKNKNPKSKQPYFFKGFFKISHRNITDKFNNTPQVADYFKNPENFIFNPHIEIKADIAHIISDNIDRFPANFKSMPEMQVRTILDGAIKTTVNRLKTNYTIAVPQYYGGNIQLLIPLHLTYSGANPDLALVVYKSEGQQFYTSRTCLTLEMAYNNARLIVKPLSSWLSADKI
ncbi:DUF3825 domain-containing protein [Enterobacter ludwigii]|uniref:DUF3825 domain-containing protein n=1 Tax=Enterobacter TaxID=547 RepID=UPI00124C72B0|nr:DUF3825 domain-containing protein [Enterobacter ludwigii]GER63378.1 hypothetical protein NMCA_23160 [Enterobacter ludwigii]